MLINFSQDWFFWSLAGLAVFTAIIALLLVIRATKPAAPSFAAVSNSVSSPWAWLMQRNWIAKLIEALTYLLTSRETRYVLPWVLLVGEKGGGKSSLVEAYQQRLCPARPPRAVDQLAGASLRTFDAGVLIDPEGRLCNADAGSTDAKRWQNLLDEIDALRPERPVDKIILVLSARTLMTGNEDALQDNARRTIDQLETIRRSFEFILPVYLVVTQCDAVPGFTEFWRTQPEPVRQQIFGWTVSPTMQSQAPEQWVEAAFAALNERLRLWLLKVAAARGEVADVDQVFLFPVGFRRLAAPLGRWFQMAFQPDNWEQRYFCRGIYFTGSVAAEGGQVSGVRDDLEFVCDVFQDRLFGEKHLACPARKSIWSRNRLLRRVQYSGVAIATAMLLALAWSSFQVNRQINYLMTTLTSINSAEKQLDNGCRDVAQIHDLLRRIDRIEIQHYYPGIPLSLVDNRVMEHSEDGIAQGAFKNIIMPAIACRMNAKIRELSSSSGKADDTVKSLPASERLAASRTQFLDHVKAVADLEQNIANFTLVSKAVSDQEEAASVKAFKELASYAFDKALPSEIDFSHGSLPHALAHFKYDTPLALSFQEQLEYRVRIVELSRNLHDVMAAELKTGATLLTELGKARDIEPHLQDDMSHLLWWLNWIRQAWLDTDATHNPCEDIRVLAAPYLAAISDKAPFPKPLSAVVDSFDDQHCFQPVIKSLVAQHASPYGNLFFLNADKKLEVNKDFLPELTGLAAVMELRYMRLSPKGGASFHRRSDITGWNPSVLLEASGYAREYLDFAQSRGLASPTASDAKHSLYDRLARSHLLTVLNDRLSEAQMAPVQAPAQAGVNILSEEERRVARESADFSSAASPLLDILGLYAQLGFTADGREIAQFARDYADDSLRRTHNLANDSQLYIPGSPDSENFPLPGDLAVTKDWLARQAARVRVLSAYASQYVAFLKNSQALVEQQWQDRRDAVFWDNTIAELERHLQFKEPNGQVAFLETVFLKLLPSMTDSNCRKQLADFVVPEYGNDLFSALRQQRLAQTQDQCTHRHDAPAFLAYQTLAENFNRELAGRFPFGSLDERDASPIAVKEFLADYAAQREQLQSLLDANSNNKRPEIRRFVEQMDKVATFFKGNLLQSPTSAPIQMAVHFNTLPKLSSGANQVLSWNLSNGAAQAAYPNQTTTLEWNWGQSLDLRLTWARDSRWRPVADAKATDLTIDGASAVFKSTGPWSLLRLVRSHRPAGGSSDPLNPDVVQLQFNVPVSAAAVGPANRSTSQLYLGLEISDRKVGTPLAWPAFPTTAPSADADASSLSLPTAKKTTNNRSKT